MDILGWMARLSKSNSLAVFNKIWLIVSVLLIVLLIAGRFFKPESPRSAESPAASPSTSSP